MTFVHEHLNTMFMKFFHRQVSTTRIYRTSQGLCRKEKLNCTHGTALLCHRSRQMNRAAEICNKVTGKCITKCADYNMFHLSIICKMHHTTKDHHWFTKLKCNVHRTPKGPLATGMTVHKTDAQCHRQT